jgi:hypothetical protein
MKTNISFFLFALFSTSVLIGSARPASPTKKNGPAKHHIELVKLIPQAKLGVITPLKKQPSLKALESAATGICDKIFKCLASCSKSSSHSPRDPMHRNGLSFN